MSRIDEIQELITLHYKRLHELKKQQALYGIAADPHISVEIEKIESEIEELQTELSASPNLEKPTSHANVLVVEDDQLWQSILRDWLVEAGYLVEIAATFKEAQSKLQSDRFGLVTIDANLSDNLGTREGMLLLDYIHSRFNPPLPVIIISGEIERRDLIRAFKKFSVMHVLLKEEFELDEFGEAVKDALQSSQP